MKMLPKCTRRDCVCYNLRWSNCCQGLIEVPENCNFYKTREEWTAQVLELKKKGKPLYEPSITRNDQRRLKALLQEGGTRGGENNLDKT